MLIILNPYFYVVILWEEEASFCQVQEYLHISKKTYQFRTNLKIYYILTKKGYLWEPIATNCTCHWTQKSVAFCQKIILKFKMSKHKNSKYYVEEKEIYKKIVFSKTEI